METTKKQWSFFWLHTNAILLRRNGTCKHVTCILKLHQIATRHDSNCQSRSFEFERIQQSQIHGGGKTKASSYSSYAPTRWCLP